MSNVNLKWAVLFVILILLPASILTYLSMRDFQNDRRSALADLNVLVPLLQEQFDRRVDAIVEQVGERQDVENGRFQIEVQGVVQTVTLREDGQIAWPRFMPLVFSDRRQAFEMILRRGEELEFRARDPEGARLALRAQMRANLLRERLGLTAVSFRISTGPLRSRQVVAPGRPPIAELRRAVRLMPQLSRGIRSEETSKDHRFKFEKEIQDWMVESPPKRGYVSWRR